MTIKIFVPRNSAAVACGADEVANAVDAAATKTKARAEIAGNGSRTMLWLEPLLEIEDNGVRYAFGPMTEVDAGEIVSSLAKTAASKIKYPLALGPTEEIPFFKKQTRLTFARCGLTDPVSLADDKAHGGYKGLERALAIKPIEIVEEVSKSGLRGCGGAGLAIPVLTKSGPCYAISLP